MDFALNFYEQNQRVFCEREDEKQHYGIYFSYEYNSSSSLDCILMCNVQFITVPGPMMEGKDWSTVVIFLNSLLVRTFFLQSSYVAKQEVVEKCKNQTQTWMNVALIQQNHLHNIFLFFRTEFYLFDF